MILLRLGSWQRGVNQVLSLFYSSFMLSLSLRLSRLAGLSFSYLSLGDTHEVLYQNLFMITPLTYHPITCARSAAPRRGRRGRARRSRAAASSTVPARSRRRARPRRSPLPTKAAACTRGVERCRGSAEATRRRRRDRALTCSRRRGPGRRAPGSCDSTRVEATRLRATPLARLRRVR